MRSLDLYQLLIEGEYSKAIDQLSSRGDENETPRSVCILALANALNMQVDTSEKLLKTINKEDVDGKVEAIYYEAEMLVAANIGDNQDEVEALAIKALHYDASSIFALRVLAQIEESRKHFEKALEYYHRALEIYPESNRTRLDIARNLIFLKERGEAIRYLRGSKKSLRKVGYQISIVLRGPLRILLILAIAFLVVNPSTAIYSFLVLTISSVAGMILSWRISDPLIFSTSAYVQISTIVFGILSYLLSRVLT